MNDSIPDATRSPTSASLLPNSTEMKPLVCPGVLDSAVDADFREVKSVSIGEQHVGLKAILRSASPSRGAAEQRSSNSSSPAASLKITSRRQRRLRWRFCDRLTTKFPYAMVHPEPIFLQDGPIYTSAGIAAGIDPISRPGRGGPGPRCGTEHRSISGDVSCPPRRPGAVQPRSGLEFLLLRRCFLTCGRSRFNEC